MEQRSVREALQEYRRTLEEVDQLRDARVVRGTGFDLTGGEVLGRTLAAHHDLLVALAEAVDRLEQAEYVP